MKMVRRLYISLTMLSLSMYILGQLEEYLIKENNDQKMKR